MSDITVYSKPRCVACRAVKRHLDKKGVEFTEIDITQDDAARESIQKQGFLQAPVVDMGNGDVFSGYIPERIDAGIKSREAVAV